jgi:hypothetical protein
MVKYGGNEQVAGLVGTAAWLLDAAATVEAAVEATIEVSVEAATETGVVVVVVVVVLVVVVVEVVVEEVLEVVGCNVETTEDDCTGPATGTTNNEIPVHCEPRVNENLWVNTAREPAQTKRN